MDENKETLRVTILALIAALFFGIKQVIPEEKTFEVVSIEVSLKVLGNLFFKTMLIIFLIYLLILALKVGYKNKIKPNWFEFVYDFSVTLMIMITFLTLSFVGLINLVLAFPIIKPGWFTNAVIFVLIGISAIFFYVNLHHYTPFTSQQDNKKVNKKAIASLIVFLSAIYFWGLIGEKIPSWLLTSNMFLIVVLLLFWNMVPGTRKTVAKKFSELKGVGEIMNKSLKIKAEFKLEFYLGQEAVLFLYLKQFSKERQKLDSLSSSEFNFQGNLDTGERIKIDKLFFVSIGDVEKGKQLPVKFKVFSDIYLNRKDFKSKHSEEIIFEVANLEFTGTEKTLTKYGGWTLDHVTLNINKYPIEIRHTENYGDIIKPLKKGKIDRTVTAKISVKAKHIESDRIRTIVHDLCWLMSFAKGNTIVPISEIYMKDNKVVSKSFHNMRIESFKSGNQVIPTIPFEEFPEFLEEVYSNYTKYKDALSLNVILNYHELMRNNPVLEAKCALGFILLETLSNKAQEYYVNQNSPIDNNLKKGQAKELMKILPQNLPKRENLIQRILDVIGYKNITLPDSIKKLMQDFGMKFEKGEGKIFDLRRHFIHKGRFPPNTDPIKTYNGIVHFINKLTLHILGYKGDFYDFRHRNRKVKLKYVNEGAKHER